MGEIVGIHIGQCGVNIGCQFWSQLIAEHSITEGTCSGARYPAVHFQQTSSGYEPRGLFFDTDSTSIDAVRGSPLGRVFPPDRYIGGRRGTGNNFATGCYTLGAELVNQIEEAICREGEKCDCLAGFQISSSLCGGTGSGLLNRVLQVLRECYCPYIVESYSVFPSPDKSETVLEGYNSIMTMSELCEHSDHVMVLDNQALNKAHERLSSDLPTVTNLNKFVANAMCGVTAAHRFPSVTRCSVRKMAVWLVPFPRLHFFSLATLPPSPRDPPLSTGSLISQIIDPNNLMCSTDPRSGVYISAVASCRGKVNETELEEQFATLGGKLSPSFVPFFMERVKGIVCNVPPPGKELDCTQISNSSTIVSVFQTLHRKFSKLHRRKAFTHLYTNEGMDEMEFREAESYAQDIISEYQQYQQFVDEEMVNESQED